MDEECGNACEGVVDCTKLDVLRRACHRRC